MNRTRVLAGMRSSGRLHLGNYLGAAKGMIALQNKHNNECFYMVADLHAMTTPFDKKTIRAQSVNVILDYLAAGLDPNKSTIFIQSEVPEHTELSFYFSTVVSLAKMTHLPTFKEKVRENPDFVSMALVNYPVLMAADILIYKAELVPVGIDQEPHLEVARDIAKKMNGTFGTNFPEPKRFATKGEYIPSLTGEGKMSKSVEGSYILLTDSYEQIKSRLAKVPTDSGSGDRVPERGGVAVLFKAVEIFEGKEKAEEYKKAYLGKGIQYKNLKENLAKAIYSELKPIQEKRKKLEKNTDYVEQILVSGAQKARTEAQKTISEVRSKLGLNPSGILS